LTEPIIDKERDLVAALRRGDTRAFDKLFKSYGKRLYGFALGYLKSKDEAEGVVQEVFYKIWKKHELLNPDFSFKAYIFKIAYNHIQELFLKLAQKRNYRDEIVNISVPFTTEMDERINYQSLLELVDRLIDQLPGRQREILIMRKKDGKAIKDIAVELGISPKTVENHITEAMKKVRDGLAGEHLSGLLFFCLFVNSDLGKTHSPGSGNFRKASILHGIMNQQQKTVSVFAGMRNK
jgi:RNA polymerase sigma-70 factor (ECF subfamily)